VISCSNTTKQSTDKIETVQNELPNLKGTWELSSFYNYKNNEVVDSFETNPDFRQLKMYTASKVMWCKHRPADSSEWFGFGSYTYEDNMLTEVLDFGSDIMNEVIEEKKEFKFELNLTENHFEQIELDEDGNRIYSENYTRIE
jgi:hypothetical protein